MTSRIDSWIQKKPDLIAPVFFVAKDLHGVRVTLNKGDLFEFQDRRSLRFWGESFGVHDAETRPFHELKYIETVIAPCAEVANEIVLRGMDVTAARAHVERWLEQNAA